MSVGGVSLPLLFGPYELLVRLGHGGMGQVYLGRRTTVAGGDSLCVVKTLKPELAEDGEYVGRFLDEVRTVMLLRHSSISHVFDAGHLDDAYYMAMEHLAGVTARDLWGEAKKGQLGVGLALLVIEDVLGALAYAHAFTSPLTGQPISVVHRDVSPHNVIVTFEGEVKLIDFGLAESVLKQEHTESHVVMGKISYMSPEQARGERVSGACDQFAAAVMLYELVSGERFYGTRNNSEIWTVVGFGGFRPDRYGELAPELRGILDRALAKDPADRFPDCGAFRAALEGLHGKRYPEATRSRLRAFMQQAFAEAQHKQQQALRRSAVVAAEVQQYTQSVTASRPGSSSSSRDGSVASSEPSLGAPQSDLLFRAAAPPEDSDATEAVRARRGKGAPWLPGIAAAAAAVIVVIGVWLATDSEPEAHGPRSSVAGTAGGQGSDEVEVRALEATASSTTRTTTSAAPHAVKEPVATQAPADSAAALATPKATPEPSEKRRAAAAPPRAPPRAPASAPTSAEDNSTTREASSTKSTAQSEDGEDGERSAGAGPKQKQKPVPLTNAEALAIVRSCKSACAPGVLSLPNVKDGSVINDARPNALLLYCAEKCR